MKRFVMAAIISATMFAAAAALLASCTWMPVLEEKGDATLTFRFLQTKAGPVPDTGSFILRVCPAGADQPVYEGRYGERPATMKVPAGTYEVSAFSRRFPTPDFGDPLYGDEQLVVARSGETLSVAFRCTQRNSGLQLAFTDRFKTRYPGRLLLKQTEGQLEYGYAEQRTAWLFPGETRICYLDGKAENLLLKRSLEPGEIRSITLDATDNGSSSTFSLTVDTTAIRHAEQVVVGQEGGDGLTMATAYSVAELAATERSSRKERSTSTAERKPLPPTWRLPPRPTYAKHRPVQASISRKQPTRMPSTWQIRPTGPQSCIIRSMRRERPIPTRNSRR